MAEVRDAILVAGGLGTRMLPASAAVAKEALPLFDIPALTHLAREAVNAGVDRLHIITSPRKDFTTLLKDNSWLLEKRRDLSSEVLSPFADIEVLVHVQDDPKGLGDAISRALHAIDGPFLVLLGDNVLLDKHTSPSAYEPSNASAQLVQAYARLGMPCVGLKAVSKEELSSYGVVAMDGERVVDIIEKPSQEDAPSNLVLCGRYLFTEDCQQLMETYAHHVELQSIFVQRHWMENDGLAGVELVGYDWFDSGAPMPWLKAQIQHALARDDVGEELLEWLKQEIQR